MFADCIARKNNVLECYERFAKYIHNWDLLADECGLPKQSAALAAVRRKVDGINSVDIASNISNDNSPYIVIDIALDKFLKILNNVYIDLSEYIEYIVRLYKKEPLDLNALDLNALDLNKLYANRFYNYGLINSMSVDTDDIYNNARKKFNEVFISFLKDIDDCKGFGNGLFSEIYAVCADYYPVSPEKSLYYTLSSAKALDDTFAMKICGIFDRSLSNKNTDTVDAKQTNAYASIYRTTICNYKALSKILATDVIGALNSKLAKRDIRVAMPFAANDFDIPKAASEEFRNDCFIAHMRKVHNCFIAQMDDFIRENIEYIRNIKIKNLERDIQYITDENTETMAQTIRKLEYYHECFAAEMDAIKKCRAAQKKAFSDYNAAAGIV
jgi:hypothetical protein